MIEQLNQILVRIEFLKNKGTKSIDDVWELIDLQELVDELKKQINEQFESQKNLE